MTFAYKERVKKAVAAVGGTLATALLFSPAVLAQQTTGQTIPETRNPQSSAVQPFRQQGGLQTSQTGELLTRDETIRIPAGRPAEPVPSDESGDANDQLIWLAVLTGIGAIAFFALWRGLSTGDGTIEPGPAAGVFEEIGEDKPAKKRKKSKGKRGSKRKKRH